MNKVDANILFIDVFVNFWARWVFTAAHGHCQALARGGGFSLTSALGLVAVASLAAALRPWSCRAWVGSVAPWRVESPISGQTCVPCSGRGMLNHCITEEAPVRS